MTAPTVPPIAWFRNPELAELTPLTVTPDGRVFGHLCGWHQTHTSFPGRNITPPRSPSDYRWFHTGSASVEDEDGQTVTISVGPLTMGTGHAATHLGHVDTAAHYDNTGSVVATVCMYEDAHGVAFAGAMLPDVDELTARRFAACGLSGDWRAIEGGKLDLVAALGVPRGGFPIPRARVASGAPLALVAAGMLPVVSPLAQLARRVADGWQLAQVASVPAARWRFSEESLADRVAEAIERRQHARVTGDRHAELLAELDDSPARFAALLERVDETPARFAGLLAEVDETPIRYAELVAAFESGDVDPKGSTT